MSFMTSLIGRGLRMVFLLFVISVAVLEAILHADKKWQRRPRLARSDRQLSLLAAQELLSQDLKSRSQDLKVLLQALQNHVQEDVQADVKADASTEPVAPFRRKIDVSRK